MGRVVRSADTKAAAAADASPIVTVGFTFQNGQASFTNQPDPIRVAGPQPIVFQLSNASTPGAQLNAFYIENNPNWQNVFPTQSVSANGRTMTVQDNNPVQPGQPSIDYQYVLTVLYNGIYYYDDPTIIDDPPPRLWIKAKTLSSTAA